MKKKILIVDDNSTNIYMLETLLNGHGFEVISANNGKDALEKARVTQPDLVVSDILMPVMDGYTLCHEWKSDDTLRTIPFVFFTATYSEPKDEVFAERLGADRFILKPVDLDAVMEIFKEVLADDYQVQQLAVKPLGEEMEFFRQYNAILFSKLEKKLLELETSNKKLQILEERYRLNFEFATDIIYMVDKDLVVSSVSPSIERILGYKVHDMLGRNFSDLKAIFVEESFVRAGQDIRAALEGTQITGAIYQCAAKDGILKYIEVNISPTLKDGRIISTVSVARDVGERIIAENEIKSLLKGKSVLLKEAHHRIKNNMNTMMGLLSLQFEALREPSSIAVLKDVMSRLETMRILYDKLYVQDDPTKMSAREYLVSLINDIVRMFTSTKIQVATIIEIEDFLLSVKILSPLGIIVNELITNAMKFAFAGKENGLITIKGFRKDSTLCIYLEDDGCGIPDTVEINNSRGFGLNLVNMLATQIGGSIRIERGNGSRFIVTIPV